MLLILVVMFLVGHLKLGMIISASEVCNIHSFVSFPSKKKGKMHFLSSLFGYPILSLQILLLSSGSPVVKSQLSSMSVSCS